MERLNYRKIIEDHPWIIEKGRKCIISPDSDGFLCGLLMSHYFNWEIAGYYDGKVLTVEKDCCMKDVVFLDMEIFRNYIRSVGHHMVLWNKNDIPENWSNFKNVIQPNILRGFDGKHNFKTKYPFATIHLLLALLANNAEIQIHKESLGVLLYTDGTFKNLFNYPENCISWLYFMSADDKLNPLNTIFLTTATIHMK